MLVGISECVCVWVCATLQGVVLDVIAIWAVFGDGA